MAKTVSIVGLESFPLVKAGDDIATLITATMQKERVALEDGDVIVVAHKVVSKAEDRIVRTRDVRPSDRAQELARITRKDPKLVELVLKEANKVVKATSEILIVENRQGFVCINAGVDKSNVEGKDAYVLLPKDSDASARKIVSEILKLTGKKVAVVICDTYSRPFRRGQVEFAIGTAGLDPFRDYRGRRDLFGYALKVKNTAIADEIASAADLTMGQGEEGMPVVIVRDLDNVTWKQNASATNLLISKEEDLFKGTLG